MRCPDHFAPATLVALLAAVGTASAHHGFTGRYDTSRPLYVAGEVISAAFGYPHAVLTVRVAADAVVTPAAARTFQGLAPIAATDNEVRVELPPVRIFNGLEDRIARGDRIALVVLRNCDPPHQLRAQWVAPASGEPVLRDRRYQGEVAQC